MKTVRQKLLVSLLLTFFISSAYAINVSVHSTASKITGLGFTVNGSKHGGMGSSYEASDMPKGMYSFGLRRHGKNIPCPANGKRKIKLTSDSTATLSFKGGRCVAKVSSQ